MSAFKDVFTLLSAKKKLSLASFVDVANELVQSPGKRYVKVKEGELCSGSMIMMTLSTISLILSSRNNTSLSQRLPINIDSPQTSSRH